MPGKAKSENRCIAPGCFKRKVDGSEKCKYHRFWSGNYQPPRKPARKRAWQDPDPVLLDKPRKFTSVDLRNLRDSELRFAEHIRWWCQERDCDPVFTQWCVDMEVDLLRGCREDAYAPNLGL